MFFDLQRFGGKGGTTIQSTYEPTQYELDLQELEVTLTKNVLLPGATVLGKKAKQLFEMAVGVEEADVVGTKIGNLTEEIVPIYDTSKSLIDEALQGLKDGDKYLADNIATLDARQEVDIDNANTRWEQANLNLTRYIDQYIHDQNDNAELANRNIKKMPSQLSKKYTTLENNISVIGGAWENNTVPNDEIALRRDTLYPAEHEDYPIFVKWSDEAAKIVSSLDDNTSFVGQAIFGKWDNTSLTATGVYAITETVSASVTIVAAATSEDFDYNLSNISTENYKDLDKLKPTLESALAVNFEDALDGIDKLSTIGSFYNNLDSLIPEYNENYQYARFEDTDHSNFNDLIDGKLPEQWKTNMKDAIKTTLKNTIGEVVNDLSNRGVINSSVATQALYDIERNASDEVAKQYLQNIQTEGQLVQNRWQVKEQSLNDQKLVLNELWGYMAQAFGLKLQAKAHDAENKRAVALALAQIFTQQFSNSSNAFTQQASFDTQDYTALNTGLSSQTQLYQAILNNQSRASADAINWYQVAKAFADTQWAHDLAPMEQLIRMYQLRIAAVNTWANTWESVLSNSGRKILLSSATQEALQQPALRMWNAATGLNQSATGVLVALSNQGTRTHTQSSSGNFLGGVLSAGLTAFAGGWGAGVAGAAFGQKQPF